MSKKLAKLVRIVDKLRSPKGCPWDRKQTHKSLKPHVVEESYEVIDAIDKNDYSKLCEELGDLLLQVVLHCQLAKEKKKFDMDDVIESISAKLVRRHPHVFSGRKIKHMSQLLNTWEKIKKGEDKKGKSILYGVPKSLPALQRAEKVQTKAARVGFDWDKVLQKGRKKQSAKEQIGNLLFSIVNDARLLDIGAEEALQAATSKYSKMFEAVEKSLHI